MKILITGCRGQLGSQIINILKEGASELGTIPQDYRNSEIIGVDIEELDISNLELVKSFINEVKPDIVINSAAYTNVDSCENNRDLALKVNSLGPRNLAIACEQVDAKLIHISTDYVFRGNGTIPYREYDVTNPVSVYGETKLLGENYVRECCLRYFIVRTAWLYGYNGNNFVKTIMKAAKEKGHLEVVNDQRGNPTNAEDLAHHILKIALTDEYGIYHCTGTGECTWYDFAKAIVKFKEIECTVSPTTSNKINRAAERPAFSSLDNMMLRCSVGDEMRDWREALKVFLEKVKI
ncbi:dTDP-4-dehydrorhamnose reductase [Clostridium aciditolerans]|uniref:dTDP-4-dehydrorhamnose reductase n=1 Tax=Clostridium aciditolerans TaxID=339861 RepID=A0A934HUP9_9CLOT|nr:dTDP-4-dehydrorhamnose reductase [Clostridium aciditolerans]MBI6873663.1 dTDP-4-dehydrorhamnose reductase [Clostridium aciditolerans]